MNSIDLLLTLIWFSKSDLISTRSRDWSKRIGSWRRKWEELKKFFILLRVNDWFGVIITIILLYNHIIRSYTCIFLLNFINNHRLKMFIYFKRVRKIYWAQLINLTLVDFVLSCYELIFWLFTSFYYAIHP